MKINMMLFYTNRRNNTFGGDLRATDIQRGRDHGLGSYVATRAACGLPVPKTFHEMQDFILAEVHVRRRNDETTDKNILLSKMGTARDQKYFYTLYSVLGICSMYRAYPVCYNVHLRPCQELFSMYLSLF